MVITKGSNSEKCNVASPLEAYFSHHKDRKKKISASVFLFTKEKKKLCCSRYMTQVFFLSLVTSFVHPPPSYWIKQGKKSIGHKVGHSSATLVFLQFEWIYTWTLSSFLLENFVLDAMLRNIEVLWQTQKASQACFKCGQNFSLSLRDFHFNFQHLLRKKALVGESISFIKCTDSLEKVGWIK